MSWPLARRFGRSQTATQSSPDSQMLRSVRIRLIAWSAGSTLLVLVVLGAALYWAVAQTLASQSTQTLHNRVDQMRAKIVAAADNPNASPGPSPTASPSPLPTETAPTASSTGGAAAQPSAGASAGAGGEPQAGSPPPNSVNITGDASEPGLVLGGPSSGTIAFALDPDSHFAVKLIPSDIAGSPAMLDIPEPDAARQNLARRGDTVVWEDDLRGIPARFLLEAVRTESGPILVEAIGDRTAEIALLRSLFIVLVTGSLAVLAAAVVFGYVYAGRALVPIRVSLQRQRDFAADASHELRTPLAIVQGAAEELRSGGADVNHERSLADIEAGTERLGQLVDDLLLLARADSGALELRHEPADLAEIATDAVGRLARRAADRSVRLRLDVAPAVVAGDPDRLGQVVAILVDNAVKHSPDGGAVTVTVREGAALAVEDEGPGIRPEDAPKLFDRFWRAPDAPAGGTGLGLSIAAWIVRSHGGTIAASNRDGGGARFEVRIPGRDVTAREA